MYGAGQGGTDLLTTMASIFPASTHFIDFVDALTVEVHTADIVIEGFAANHLVAIADGKVVYDFLWLFNELSSSSSSLDKR